MGTITKSNSKKNNYKMINGFQTMVCRTLSQNLGLSVK
ncbi:hypothetical protein LEP1GSC096_0880 [Leptospira interrogans serovar Hebdomadis str. R499]|nr:hypothetical protein LEP1GSC014_0926 [Leptospira interrogans serovar Pomona str. Pomona]EKR35322.1 hypothetical protein LEP1GSC096_0880 [Leptospira interrogans serovar Hebdomadis str. R499]EKR85056.1 hypothetical protein LEP1GSC099_1514 [Leptospira interrogans str. UI 08452]EMF31403.1 hypothetical protein LEP1GSC201_3541 [Leptospira interrogans serovar Pomona str. Fox 32256]EMN33459.1 hypothetical protein LEP1GSC084_1687 [Leptospira interrogans serovar Medanensis str. L0448]